MGRNTLSALLAASGLMTWGAAESFAQGGPGLTLRPQAILVTQVVPGGPAARQGIEPGDVIVSVNGHPVRSLADLQYRVGQAGPVARLGVVEGRTGWQAPVLVYPSYGRIGVDVRPTSAWNAPPIQPGWPIRPSWPNYSPWVPSIQPVPPLIPGYQGLVAPRANEPGIGARPWPTTTTPRSW